MVCTAAGLLLVTWFAAAEFLLATWFPLPMGGGDIRSRPPLSPPPPILNPNKLVLCPDIEV